MQIGSAVVHRFLSSDEGQDLVEYALLTAFIGLAGAAAATLILSALQTSYANWDTTNQNLWVPADPAGS